LLQHLGTKDSERNLCQDLLTVENTDSDLKVHALRYANKVLAGVRLSFQKLLQTRFNYPFASKFSSKTAEERKNVAIS